MKLININIGIKIDNSSKIAEFIGKQNADVVTFQEIIRHLDDKVFIEYRSKSEIESLAGKKYPYKFFSPLWVTDAIRDIGKIKRDFGGLVEQGNEIMSKYPIVGGTNEFFYKHFSYELDWTNWINEDHGRAVQITELDISGKSLQILNLHGIWTADKRGDERTINECKYLVMAAQRKNIATIIVGDFNLLPDTRSIKIIGKKFRNLINEYDIKSTRPEFDDGRDHGQMAIDYVFVSGDIKVNDFKVIDTDISDHLPLFLDFVIK